MRKTKGMSCELRVILLIFQGCNTEQLKDLKVHATLTIQIKVQTFLAGN